MQRAVCIVFIHDTLTNVTLGSVLHILSTFNCPVRRYRRSPATTRLLACISRSSMSSDGDGTSHCSGTSGIANGWLLTISVPPPPPGRMPRRKRARSAPDLRRLLCGGFTGRFAGARPPAGDQSQLRPPCDRPCPFWSAWRPAWPSPWPPRCHSPRWCRGRDCMMGQQLRNIR